MCSQCNLPSVPYSDVQFFVKFCGVCQGWEASATSETVTDGGDIIRHGRQNREFGPFDSFTDVQHWLASAASVLRRIPDQTLKVWTPAGGDLPAAE